MVIGGFMERSCLAGDLAATKKEEDQKKLVLCEIHEFVSHEYPGEVIHYNISLVLWC